MKMFVEPSVVYLHRQFVDFRKSINGLAMIVEQNIDESVLSGALFVFCNKNKDKLKLQYWDKTGFALWYKRLEKDKFKWPNTKHANVMTLSKQQLDWLLGGYDIIGHQTINTEPFSL